MLKHTNLVVSPLLHTVVYRKKFKFIALNVTKHLNTPPPSVSSVLACFSSVELDRYDKKSLPISSRHLIFHLIFLPIPSSQINNIHKKKLLKIENRMNENIVRKVHQELEIAKTVSRIRGSHDDNNFNFVGVYITSNDKVSRKFNQ